MNQPDKAGGMMLTHGDSGLVAGLAVSISAGFRVYPSFRPVLASDLREPQRADRKPGVR